MIITTVEGYYKLASGLINDSTKGVKISSYNMYAGISHAGVDWTSVDAKFASTTHDYLRKLETVPNVQILVGLVDYKCCHSLGCINCEMLFVKSCFRLLEHASAFSKFQWKMAEKHHYKCIIYDNPKPILLTGGRNLTDSDWADASFAITDKVQISEMSSFFDTLWDKASLINDDLIDYLLSSRNISNKALQILSL